MKGKVQWKDVALIVLVALLIAVPVGRISYSFGAGNVLSFLKQAQADQAQAVQLWKEAKAQSDKVKGMSLNDNEKELATLSDKIVAAASAGQKANADLVAGLNEMLSFLHHI